MNNIHIVISVWHGYNKNAIFVHGAFDSLYDAELVLSEIQKNKKFIEDEGYDLNEEQCQTVYISTIPYNSFVSDYVPTLV